MKIVIAESFSTTPGARYRTDGPFSGEEFREELLEPAFLQSVDSGAPLLVDLDGTNGYATSFLDEAFGGLARLHGLKAVMKALTIKSDDEPELIDEIKEYVSTASHRR